MEFAASLSTGKTYEALKVNYAQAKTLKLVCPVCKEKVFKRVRRIPHETHMFAHHKGGSPDCELYFPASSDRSLTTTGFSVSRGQTFEQFIRDIDADLQSLLVKSGVIEDRIDRRFLDVLGVLVGKESKHLAPSFAAVEFSGLDILGVDAGPANDIAAVIYEFYSRDGARFIDALICNWFLYSIYVNHEKADIGKVLGMLISKNEDGFSALAGVMLTGLAWFYAKDDLTRFSWNFRSKLFHFAENLPIQVIDPEAPRLTPLLLSFPDFVFRDHPSAPEMVVLPRGQFVMGSPEESPQHTVHISYALAVGKYPITFAQWDACVKDGGTKYKPDDEGWGRGSRPVINVSWNEIELYLRWLSKVIGKTYRLLSEAEWEYAARAGSQTAYSFGDDEKDLGRFAWFEENSGGKTHPVGEKLPNAFGLHDMYGNVWEWTQDCWNDNYQGAPTDGRAWSTGNCSSRVVRGGSWFSDSYSLHSATRGSDAALADADSDAVGFRVARTD